LRRRSDTRASRYVSAKGTPSTTRTPPVEFRAFPEAGTGIEIPREKTAKAADRTLRGHRAVITEPSPFRISIFHRIPARGAGFGFPSEFPGRFAASNRVPRLRPACDGHREEEMF
jgi:hypothetical protein